MKGFQFVKGAAVCLATMGTMLPQGRLLADDTAKQATAAPKAQRPASIPDISLTTGAKMSGRVVDHTGKPMEGAKVTLRQDKKDISSTVTNKDGIYSFNNMKSGVYYVTSGNTSGIFRVWAEKTAPPTSKEHALLVMGENGARGQFGAVDPTLVLLTAGVIAAVVLSAVALDKINSLDNKVNKLLPASP